MTATPSSVLDALRAYIQTEMAGLQFYRKAAERTENSLGKKMFQSLADEESEHARKLSREYSSLSENGRWLAYEEVAKEEHQVKETAFPVFPIDDQKLVSLIPEGASDLEALKIAMDMEKVSYDQYAKAAGEVSGTAAQAFFKHLMEEESRHFKILQSSYNYLADTGGWFQEMEKPIFEG